MMTFGYSISANAFFIMDLKGRYQSSNSWPDDVKVISDEIWQAFTVQPAAGKRMNVSKAGVFSWKVSLEDALIIKEEEKIWLKQCLLEQAEREIRLLSVVQGVYGLKESEKCRVTAFNKYLADLYRYDPKKSDSADWPSFPE